MLEAQQQLHERLTGPQAVAEAQGASTGSGRTLVGPANIVGSYIGEKWSEGRPTGQIGVVVMVRDKYSTANIAPQSVIPKAQGVGDTEVVVDVHQVGDPKAYQGFRLREADARYGASISLRADGVNPFETGSFGCLCLVRDGADELVCVLSNNHILAGVNQAPDQAAVIQPGSADGGFSSAVVGNLVRSVPLNVNNNPSFPAQGNRVDAAVMWTSYDHFEPAFHTPGLRFNPQPAAATLFMNVIKEGRTTGFTRGTVRGLNAMVTPVAYLTRNGSVYGGFTGQILIQGTFGQLFSDAGDSGSLVCGLVGGEYRPVGLLFAGNSAAGVTWANPIDEVMSALDITQILDREI